MLLLAVLGLSSLLLIGEIDERVSGPVTTHAAAHAAVHAAAPGAVDAAAPAAGTGSLVRTR